jgi:hypothetical protein
MPSGLVTLCLPSGRELPTIVVAESGELLEVDLPAVLPEGTRVRVVRGGDEGGATEAETEVVTAAPGHRLTVHRSSVNDTERRSSVRRLPPRPLAVLIQISRPDGRVPAKGALSDVCSGGIGFLTTAPIRRGDRLWITVGDPFHAPLAASVDADVIHVEQLPDGRRRVGCVFVNPSAAAALVRELAV